MFLFLPKMNLQKDGALQTNAVRHADAKPDIGFTNQVKCFPHCFSRNMTESSSF
jgi:hypothetical protein